MFNLKKCRFQKLKGKAIFICQVVNDGSVYTEYFASFFLNHLSMSYNLELQLKIPKTDQQVFQMIGLEQLTN